MGRNELVKAVNESLQTAEEIFAENKNDPHVKCSLDIAKALLRVFGNDLTTEQYQSLQERYNVISGQYEIRKFCRAYVGIDEITPERREELERLWSEQYSKQRFPEECSEEYFIFLKNLHKPTPAVGDHKDFVPSFPLITQVYHALYSVNAENHMAEAEEKQLKELPAAKSKHKK